MTRFRTAAAAAALLACACPGASAQSTNMLMPEGSKELHVGALAALVPRNEGRTGTRLVVLPTASGLWSNGVFASIGEVGWDVTGDPTMDYGPVVSYGIRSRRADGAGRGGSLDIEPGLF